MVEDLEKRGRILKAKNRGLLLLVIRMKRLQFIAAIKNLQLELPPFK
jgi:hypothetical protein